MTELVETAQPLLEESVLYIYHSHADPLECPWCGWTNGTKSNKEKAFQAHIRSSHEHKAIKAYEQQTMSPALIDNPDRVTDASVAERLGLEVLDELDKPNYLAVDPEVRRQAEARGAVLRWAAPDKVNYWKNQGGEPVPYTGPAYSRKQNSTEDGLQKANEMVLFEIPEPVVEKRKAIKARLTETQLRSRGEERPGGGKDRDDLGQQAYEAFLREGKDKATAQQLADTIVRGVDKGNIRQREGVREGYMHIKDQRGERSL